MEVSLIIIKSEQLSKPPVDFHECKRAPQYLPKYQLSVLFRVSREFPKTAVDLAKSSEVRQKNCLSIQNLQL